MRMFLHAGTHKTGTTSVQRVLATHRGWLREHGIVYPNSAPFLGGSHEAHLRVAHALTGTDPAAVAAAGEFLDQLAGDLVDDEAALLSAEPLWRHIHGTRSTWPADVDYWTRRRAYLDAVAAALHRWDITVLVTLREPASLAASLYLEAVLAGTCDTDFDGFLDDRAPFFDPSAQIAAVEEHLGPVCVDHHGPDAVARFHQRLGVPEPPALAGAPRLRTAVDPRLVEWVRRQPPAGRATQRAFASSRAARWALDGGPPGGPWRSEAHREAFRRRYGGHHGRARSHAPVRSRRRRRCSRRSPSASTTVTPPGAWPSGRGGPSGGVSGAEQHNPHK
ncbi:MAG: hypothetical protein WEB09_05150 [Nitriliruptor sp.]